ncbi:hypothetical protein HS125_13665 [bacterium]|nr:hypothetical protein [bacterium]
MKTEDFPPLDRTALSVGSLKDQGNDLAYWLSRTPQERWATVELFRRLNYGFDPATSTLQRVLEVTKRERR